MAKYRFLSGALAILVRVYDVEPDTSYFVTNIHIGRPFDMSGPVPRLGAEVSRWYGDWDEDTLITWTSNIQGRTTNPG